MNVPQILGLRTACPYCTISARLQLKSINHTVECPKCEARFQATPAPKDVFSLSAGCSTTKQLYALGFKREGLKHRFETVFDPCGDAAGQLVKTASLKIDDVDFGAFVCPSCKSRALDHCTTCNTWICQGAAHHTPAGRKNYCPNCGPAIFSQPVVEVPLYNSPPLQRSIEVPLRNNPPMLSRVVPPASATRLALPAASWLAKIRGRRSSLRLNGLSLCPAWQNAWPGVVLWR
jgi:hypothetical protein